mmetsp:Transcript_116448/g.182012  ORF Transcript_116448/g.182012 Transcript_116448/m.182012 type:complete len:335 (-) Transcript_116448:70-1074(-)
MDAPRVVIPETKKRFGEPSKFLPVAFIVFNILTLWSIYVSLHCWPALERRTIEAICFNVAAVMLVICYLKCILTHPGTIPDSGWEYTPPIHDIGIVTLGAGANQSHQETKRSGDRRHCKWCSKFKPDRCHHCRVCRTCVLKMDHHCPWIYNCVGFKNHKYFFLLLFYGVITTQIIMWTMIETVSTAVDPETPFFKMFFLLFGETLAWFLGVLIASFFGFHIWLTSRAMTTIEFCEKSMKRFGYDSSVYHRGWLGNVKAVLGDNPYLWFMPLDPPSGDGLSFWTEESPMLFTADADIDSARDVRREIHQKDRQPKKAKGLEAGTGECGTDGGDSE